MAIFRQGDLDPVEKVACGNCKQWEKCPVWGPHKKAKTPRDYEKNTICDEFVPMDGLFE